MMRKAASCLSQVFLRDGQIVFAKMTSNRFGKGKCHFGVSRIDFIWATLGCSSCSRSPTRILCRRWGFIVDI